MDAPELTQLLTKPDHQLSLDAIRRNVEVVKGRITASLKTTSDQIENDNRKFHEEFDSQNVEQLI